LKGGDTCNSFNFGKFLGEGKSGTVYELKDDDYRGLPVVLKEFTIKDAPEVKELKDGRLLYLLSSSLNDIVMSSIFHSFYSGKIHHCITFPYFEGFFCCGRKGYSALEKLDATFSTYIGGPKFKPKVFRDMLFQVLFAIKFISKRKVMHNDLHAKNVMMRSIVGISYRGEELDQYQSLAFVDGDETYYQKNRGIIAKIMDFDFAAQYSDPVVVAQKVYLKGEDNWNLQFRFGCSYDTLTFVAYMVYYTTIRTPGGGKLSKKDIEETRRIVAQVAEYIVWEAERQDCKIKNLGHFVSESSETSRDRDAVCKLMDMVSVPQYRPYEKYCHLRLDGILQLSVFEDYKRCQGESIVVSNM
jgi:serine/threonine protein kinase